MPTQQSSKAASVFKKKPQSNPSQIRTQFMSQVTGDTAPYTPAAASITLRPTKDVLSRLRFDPAYDIQDFVIGCIDRQAGIVEIPVAEWKEQESQDCIAYFKDIKKGTVVWDRVSKTDLLFS